MPSIQDLINTWYGMTLPVMIQSREEEIEDFQRNHEEVPQELWEFVSHPIRHLRMWARECIDIVIWYDDRWRLIQDVVFKDAYESDVAWRAAILDVLKTNHNYNIVFHLE